MLNMSSLNTSNYLDFFSCAVHYFFPLTTKLKVAEKPQTQQLTNQKQTKKQKTTKIIITTTKTPLYVYMSEPSLLGLSLRLSLRLQY